MKGKFRKFTKTLYCPLVKKTINFEFNCTICEFLEEEYIDNNGVFCLC